MKTCPKCGYDKLADTARFCHKCGCDCAAVQVKRTPAAEEPEAAPLVGDKNLINESTIIGKQEKYEASNITIHNNITEDHSHTTIVCAASGKRIYLDHSVVCPKCGKQVALEYYVEASKRCENCEQQAREEYRAFVVRTTGAGPLDAACKQQLDAEAQRLRIDAATQASILRARQQKPAGKSAELTSVQRAELEAAVSRLITATEPEPAQKSLEALTVLHENSSNYEAGYWYFLARAVVCPEESVKAYEEELTDDYWQRFWGFLSYCNTGSPKGGAAVDRLRSVFGQREDDIRLAEAVYYLARGFDAFETSMLERAGELASSVRREYLSKPLISVYDTLQRLVRENIRLEEKYTPMETFVLVDVFRAGKYIEYLCVEQARKEQEAREAEARREQEAREAEAKLERERQTAEQALRRKQAEMSADRSKRMEQEMARLGGAKPAATQQADSKAFAGYETVVPGTKKRNWGKTILIVVVCLIALIGLLFLIPAPEVRNPSPSIGNRNPRRARSRTPASYCSDSGAGIRNSSPISAIRVAVGEDRADLHAADSRLQIELHGERLGDKLFLRQVGEHFFRIDEDGVSAGRPLVGYAVFVEQVAQQLHLADAGVELFVFGIFVQPHGQRIHVAARHAAVGHVAFEHDAEGHGLPVELFAAHGHEPAHVHHTVLLGRDGHDVGIGVDFADDLLDGLVGIALLAGLDEIGILGEAGRVEQQGYAIAAADFGRFADVAHRHGLAAGRVVGDGQHDARDFLARVLAQELFELGDVHLTLERQLSFRHHQRAHRIPPLPRRGLHDRRCALWWCRNGSCPGRCRPP